MLTVKNPSNLRTGAKVEELLHFALGARLVNDVTVVLLERDNALDRLAPGDYELQAILYQYQMPHTYALIVRSNPCESIEYIVFHECIHLMQYESGRLEVNIRSGKCTWEGKEFAASFPYMDRPWEKEAFKDQTALMKDWRALQKSVKKVRKCLFKKKK